MNHQSDTSGKEYLNELKQSGAMLTVLGDIADGNICIKKKLQKFSFNARGVVL